VKDIFFGRYDALVEFDSEPERSSHTSEGDWFDATDADWTANDFVLGGQNKNATRQVWKYFARYATYWLEKTRPAGQNRNSSTESGLTQTQRYAWDARGIDGLRCDFGQGLPPQAWEYMINAAREKKWNFVMMSESLDGGAVTYRSNRHFDILNENIVFPLKTATTKSDYRGIFESRRDVYGQALVLINNVSHDEENYDDPWEALIRFSVAGTMDGAPMIFPGQELGISRTTGYNHYELNFGKQVPHFKRFNSMQPIWSDSNFGNDQLYPVYAGMGTARGASKALRSSNRWFLDGDGNNAKIHAVAKYEASGSSPAFQDVVLAFANLDRNAVQSDNFKIPNALATHLGLQDSRTYNVKNIAAYENAGIGMGERRNNWLWGAGYTGAQLKSAGFFLSLNRVPTMNTSANSSDAAWNQRPFEAQYLKLHDVTPPPGSAPNASYYQIGTTGMFTWTSNAGVHDNIAEWRISIGTTPGGSDVANNLSLPGGTSGYNFTGTAGATYYATLTAISGAGVSSTSAGSDSGAPNSASQTTPVILLSATGDQDGDGMTNAAEQTAGTNPLSQASVLKVTSSSRPSGTSFDITWSSVPGKIYRVQASTTLASNSFTDISGDIPASAGAKTSYSDVAANGLWKFYRVRVLP
jgi:Bacterial TSP3 repeat